MSESSQLFPTYKEMNINAQFEIKRDNLLSQYRLQQTYTRTVHSSNTQNCGMLHPRYIIQATCMHLDNAVTCTGAQHVPYGTKGVILVSIPVLLVLNNLSQKNAVRTSIHF
jgi:hypothetical protein